MNQLEIMEVLRYLPHRYPFLLVDRVLSLEPGKSIVGLKNVTINEPFFQGHFPHHPVMPGVLIIESLAQTAAILQFKSSDTLADNSYAYYFVGIDSARFRAPVTPGDQLTLSVQLIRFMRGIWKFAAEAKVGDSLVAEAELMCTVKSLK